jgi:hypothetical protein
MRPRRGTFGRGTETRLMTERALGVRGDMALPPNKPRVSRVPYMIRHEEVGPVTFQAVGKGLRAGF